MGRIFSLEYGNCQNLTHAPMLMYCFIRAKLNFERKIMFFPLRNVPFLYQPAIRRVDANLIIHFSLHYLSSGRSNKGKFQTFSSKSGRGSL